MTEKTKFNKISKVRNYREHILLNNTVVGTRQWMQYQLDGENYWYNMCTEDEIRKICDISSLSYWNNVEKTPEGQKLWDEYKAKQDEEDDED